jgi:hypothetical protein
MIGAVAVFAPAMAWAVAVPAGQYEVTTILTGLNDPYGVCAPSFKTGVPGRGVATLNGLGLAWQNTGVLVSASPPYGLDTLQCKNSPLPTATSFVGDKAPFNVSSTCTDAGGTLSFTYSNGSTTFGSATSTITVLPANGKVNGLRIDATNVVVTVGSAQICAISLQSVLLRTGK